MHGTALDVSRLWRRRDFGALGTGTTAGGVRTPPPAGDRVLYTRARSAVIAAAKNCEEGGRRRTPGLFIIRGEKFTKVDLISQRKYSLPWSSAT